MNSFYRMSLVILLAGSMSIAAGGCKNEIIENDQILTFSVSPDGQYAVVSVFNEDDPWNMEQKLYAINLADNSSDPRLFQQDDSVSFSAWRNTDNVSELTVCSNTYPNSVITRRAVRDGAWAEISTTPLIPPVCDVYYMQWNLGGTLQAMCVYNGKQFLLALASDKDPYPKLTPIGLANPFIAWTDDSTLYWVNEKSLVKAHVDSTEVSGEVEIAVEGEVNRLFGCIDGKPVYAKVNDELTTLNIGNKTIASYEDCFFGLVDGSYLAVGYEGGITVFDGSGQTIHTRDVGEEYMLIAISAATKTVYLKNVHQAIIESYDFSTEGSEMLVVFAVE